MEQRWSIQQVVLEKMQKMNLHTHLPMFKKINVKLIIDLIAEQNL